MKDVLPDARISRSARTATPSARPIPEITRIAWRDKREEIEKLNPGAARGEVRLQPVARRNTTRPTGPTTRSRACWRASSRFSTGWCRRSARCEPLQFKAPTQEAEALFLESFKRHARAIRASRWRSKDGRLDLPNTDFDTGQSSAHGEYSLADDTYRELLDRSADRRFTNVPSALRANIHRYFATMGVETPASRKARKRIEKIKRELAALDAP